MFEQLERKKWRVSPRTAVWMAVLGAFGSGFLVGGYASGAQPWDGSWTLATAELAVVAGIVIWLAIAAIRGR